MPRIWSHNRPNPKLGSTILGVTSDETDPNDPENDPVLISWDVGKGRTLAFIWDWGGNGVVSFYHWEYWKDAIARLIYYPVRATIPSDVSLTHKLRLQISLYSSEKGLLLSLMEFADTFGANTIELNQNLAETEILRKEADELWIQEDYAGSLVAIGDALASLAEDMEDAVKAKDRALLWVYIIEWLSVMGTSLLTGVILWSLMVRRRLYRDVGATRFES